MELLVLGGTRFVGAALVEAAREHGWRITVLNRGQSGPSPEGVQVVVADRTRDIGPALKGRWFDLAIDTWSGAPEVMTRTVHPLASTTDHYVYVSTRSVYQGPIPLGANEEAPVVDGDPDAAAINYAADKRGAELAVLRAFGEQHCTILRCGLILGPRETIGRLPWWLDRIARGGDILAPGPADLQLQYVDVRDLAAFALICGPARVPGVFDVTCPRGHTTMGQLLDLCASVTRSNANLVWIDPDALARENVEPWSGLPIWIPPGHEASALHHGNTHRAISAGLTCRSTRDTVTDTWAWMRSVDWSPTDGQVGLEPDRERDLFTRLNTHQDVD